MKKKKPVANKSKSAEKKPEPSLQDFFVLGHFVKYNMYLLTKAVVFSSIASRFTNLDDAVSAANSIINKLDQNAPPTETTQEQTEQTH